MKILFKCFLISSRLVTIMLVYSPISTLCEPIGVIINEIMYGPRTGEPEWIEIYNISAESIDLKGWTIEDADSTRPRELTNHSILLKSNSYACIVQDSSGFIGLFPTHSCSILQPLNGWPRLNNSKDRIVLRDSTGKYIDTVAYDHHWGGGNGKSLERIHPDWPGNSSETWSTSVSDLGSTPCEQNSMFASSLHGKANISVNPDPFDIKTTISYKLTVPRAIVKLHVYDIQGRLVKTLIDQEPSGSTGSIMWNGKDDQGRGLRMGIYILYLEAIHAEMGVLDRAKKTVTLAKKLD